MTRTMTMTGSVPAITRSAARAAEASLFDRLWLALAVWQERRALARLDGRALHDLGLSRADVEHEVMRSPFDLPKGRK